MWVSTDNLLYTGSYTSIQNVTSGTVPKLYKENMLWSVAKNLILTILISYNEY
jgi:hypothetical protein